jgi:hypothetical protein
MKVESSSFIVTSFKLKRADANKKREKRIIELRAAAPRRAGDCCIFIGLILITANHFSAFVCLFWGGFGRGGGRGGGGWREGCRSEVYARKR